MIAGPVEKHLRLVFEPTEGAAVNDPIAIALKLGSPRGRRFRIHPSPRGAAMLRVRREALHLAVFQFKTGGGQVVGQLGVDRSAFGNVDVLHLGVAIHCRHPQIPSKPALFETAKRRLDVNAAV